MLKTGWIHLFWHRIWSRGVVTLRLVFKLFNRIQKRFEDLSQIQIRPFFEKTPPFTEK